MALLSLNEITLTYDRLPLLDHIDLQVHPGERLCLLGRNGAGKSTLMKIITGDLSPNSGDVVRQKNTRFAMLGQDVPRGLSGTIRQVVSEHAPQTTSGPPVVDIVLTRLELDPDAEFQSLSVGLKRRTLLGRALATSPDVLLLDEPTNHLDIDTITWLEEFLLKQRSALLFVTHDRMFTRRLATRILELDRGNLFSSACDYDTYLKRREALLDAETTQQENFDRKLAEEEVWIRKGIRARRTRDEGRVRALEAMREERRRRRNETGQARIQIQEGNKTSRLVIEAENISFAYNNKPVVENFSTSILRGDKIGFIGPNGAGKTTLLRLLLNKLEPQQGTVTHGLRLQVAYFDQLREQLDESKTVFDTVAGGNDRVTVNGKTRHIFSYLEDFLFEPAQARSIVKILSGGERNRLLLAKLFTLPANVLALDEPTNDLDVETLDILEAMLVDFPGTVLLVSHDRAFLNNVVTSTIAFEGPHGTNEYVGGYDDWLRQRPASIVEQTPIAKSKPQKPTKERARKLSYKEQKELDTLPAHIETLETEQENIHQTLSNPASYQNGTDIAALNTRLKTLETDLETAFARWEALEEIHISKPPGE
ncbi:MAG: ATP-binding cassette domain-containing protein [bacterium]|nr:ATP-binding cassette domain-containing protein [bacterium]